MKNVCQRYGKDMPGVIPRLQILDNYLKQRYALDIPKICQRYARSKLKTTTYIWFIKNVTDTQTYTVQTKK